MPKSFPARAAAAALLAFVAAACSVDNPVGAPTQMVAAPDAYVVGQQMTRVDVYANPEMPWNTAWVCKEGTSASFTVTINGAAAPSVSLQPGYCQMVHEWVPIADANGNVDMTRVDNVVVTEVPATGVTLDSIVKDTSHAFNRFRQPTITGTNSVELQLTRSKGGIVTYYNRKLVIPPPPPPPATFGGCTPGYWKQSHHFDSWPAQYSPNMLFSSVFENAFPGMTLRQVLAQGGGGLNALGRHTVAALLNSGTTAVGYGLSSPQAVIDAFNAAYLGSNYETLKNQFAAMNERGCPLN